jgi:hypothetical protein
MLIGELEYDSVTAEPIRFREDPDGHMRLWCLLDKDGNLPRDHKYVLGNDVAAGTGASNSASCGYDVKTNEKVLEYTNAYIRPEEFAKQAVAIGRWLRGIYRLKEKGPDDWDYFPDPENQEAYMVWESNGPGRQFGSRVVELGYGHIYFRKREEAISKNVTQIPGWASTKETKHALVSDYRAAIEQGRLVNRSREALEECLEYVFDTTGGVSHSRENDKEDPSGAKANHGDRVIADALAYRGLSERTVKLKINAKPQALPGSLAWRMEQRKKEELNLIYELDRSKGW